MGGDGVADYHPAMPRRSADLRRKLAGLIAPYRVTGAERFRISDVDPGDTGPLDPGDKDAAADLLARGIERLREQQDRLYAQNRRALLVILQAMDAAGKDSTIRHVMSGLNPQGVEVHAFREPSLEELDHDWMWRCWRRLPERGRIGIFNRSYYEEALVVRVHPAILAAQHLPPELVDEDIFDERLKDMRRFERYLTRNGTTVVKFLLHVSRQEQKKRFLERLDEPGKHWKFSARDVAERRHWDRYMRAYQDAVRATATPESPWYVVPADHKWFTRLVVAGAIVDTLEGMRLAYPKPGKEARAELAAARRDLEKES
jgi:PPK2 family polyphosphate:nucleotide phosphotransferase